MVSFENKAVTPKVGVKKVIMAFKKKFILNKKP